MVLWLDGGVVLDDKPGIIKAIPRIYTIGCARLSIHHNYFDIIYPAFHNAKRHSQRRQQKQHICVLIVVSSFIGAGFLLVSFNRN